MDNLEVKFEQSHSLNREIQLDKIHEENPRDSRDEVTSHGDEEQREKLIRLPLGRIKTIIKMDPEVCLVNQEATFLVAKSVEFFIESLAKEAYKYTAQAKKKTVQKRDVENAIDNVDALVFLEGMLD
ncbi:DNA polymerase epsilon subunit 4 [Atta colombica]|uniref:DNA polymerase epsilon subunit 4 n=1 Tax=Atta colombica TaxID=520822 RepID=A0A195BBZ9_9HYME|nr:PREDICTED: DNA polymerase epsilon subunit 4 [Atta colombica]XP_018049317.1 PREDICTED: DNA polymerase epsilon subunit 4 [Atta colombica]XP_018049318.1 PREDICTED: DNA polymerase epsilon subunit 4 [Atta colombica]XP_018049319.1 PREDICTED: DNA polymerase epsilon subunit 4 [Atta colombica]XP_018049320.1 PREDICTED: DNA polymerase epsilon subunit 4 [Atta colombica]XP_018049322.1 PREDICTED: DNA polymerase epsilon subunit 4 [Atta colombica]KYM82078.1 DNA polymerase epsilon subunit 4 [Atta colombica